MSSAQAMTIKFVRLILVVTATLTISATAQTSTPPANPGSAATAPSSPAPAPSAPAAPTVGPITGTKVGAINMEGAIFSTNEGRRDMETLSKKFEPKNGELKNQNDELEGLKKQLTTQQDKLNPDALDTLKKQIESKQKTFDRSYQDFQEEVNNQQQEIASRILQKMAQLIVKYAQDNGFGMVIDTSKPWPQGPVLISGENVDITKGVVDAYNAQYPVAATAAAKPATPKTASAAGTAPKPAAPKTTDTPK